MAAQVHRRRPSASVDRTRDAAPGGTTLLVAVELTPTPAVQAVWRITPDARKAPLAVATGGRILAVCSRAAAAGVAPGQSVAQARLHCPDLQVAPPQPPVEPALWEEMLAALGTVSPRVEAADPASGLAYLDAHGLQGVWGDGAAVARAALRAVAGQGLSARAGVGSTRAVALALARRMDADGPRVLTGAAARTFLHALPIDDPVLGLAPAVAVALRELGIATVGAFATLPPAGLGLRFGPSALSAWRLATSGDEPPLRPWTPPESLQVTRRLEDGLADAVLLARLLRELSAELAARLTEREQATALLALSLCCDDGTRHDARTRCWPPLGTAAALHTTALVLLARLRPTAPVETAALRAVQLCQPEAQQEELWALHPAQQRRERLDRTLAAQARHHEHLRLRRLRPDPLHEEGWRAEDLELGG